MRERVKCFVVLIVVVALLGGQLTAQKKGQYGVSPLLSAATTDNTKPNKAEPEKRVSNVSEQATKPSSAVIATGSIKARTQIANPPIITARFVPDSVAIGDQFMLEVEVTKDMMQVVAFPEFPDRMLGEVVEILEESELDTLKSDGRRVTLSKKYRLTSFDEGWYGLGLFPTMLIDKNIVDTLWSADSLYLKVGTFEIDTATMSIYDVKRPMRTPLKFGEISGYIIWGLIALGILGVLVWYLFTRRNNLSLLGKPKVIVPPHVLAIKALEALHHQKLWQNDRHKLYYTGITEILREYIEARYHIGAKEMTTPEIIVGLESKELPEKSFRDLKELLEIADLVKFAKLIPEGEQNEMVYTNGYYFVEATKPTETEPGVSEQEIEEILK